MYFTGQVWPVESHENLWVQSPCPFLYEWPRRGGSKFRFLFDGSPWQGLEAANQNIRRLKTLLVIPRPFPSLSPATSRIPAERAAMPVVLAGKGAQPCPAGVDEGGCTGHRRHHRVRCVLHRMGRLSRLPACQPACQPACLCVLTRFSSTSLRFCELHFYFFTYWSVTKNGRFFQVVHFRLLCFFGSQEIAHFDAVPSPCPGRQPRRKITLITRYLPPLARAYRTKSPRVSMCGSCDFHALYFFRQTHCR